MSAATKLMVDLARIQANPKLRRELEEGWKKQIWPSDEMAKWSRWAWKQGLKQ